MIVIWDGERLDERAAEVDRVDVVIILAGRSVNCRDHAIESRIKSTGIVGEAIANAAPTQRVWLQASAATILAAPHPSPNTEFMPETMEDAGRFALRSSML